MDKEVVIGVDSIRFGVGPVDVLQADSVMSSDELCLALEVEGMPVQGSDVKFVVLLLRRGQAADFSALVARATAAFLAEVEFEGREHND